MENNRVHLIGNYYADCSDPLNFIPYVKKTVTQEMWDKFNKTSKEKYKVGDEMFVCLNRYYPNIMSLIEGLLRIEERNLAKNEIELKDYIDKLGKMYDKNRKEILKNLEGKI